MGRRSVGRHEADECLALESCVIERHEGGREAALVLVDDHDGHDVVADDPLDRGHAALERGQGAGRADVLAVRGSRSGPQPVEVTSDICSSVHQPSADS